ncbi:MAG: Fur family transcriptional regulator [Paludibacteraceae bacterium]
MMDSRDFLERHGIQYTRERAYIVDYLLNHHTHPTADEIYNGLLDKRICVARATVFNTLKSLTSCGALVALQITEGTTRYDIEKHRHAHFRCIRCGNIEDMPLSDVRAFSLPEGYKLLHEDCYLTGLCACCRGVKRE